MLCYELQRSKTPSFLIILRHHFDYIEHKVCVFKGSVGLWVGGGSVGGSGRRSGWCGGWLNGGMVC